MRPITWTNRSVRLVCDQCGAHTLEPLEGYKTRLDHQGGLTCRTCGFVSKVSDRRFQREAPLTLPGTAREPAF
jgi:RNase P subunit RPR2